MLVCFNGVGGAPYSEHWPNHKLREGEIQQQLGIAAQHPAALLSDWAYLFYRRTHHKVSRIPTPPIPVNIWTFLTTPQCVEALLEVGIKYWVHAFAS
jgi:hypothetical protein